MHEKSPIPNQPRTPERILDISTAFVAPGQGGQKVGMGEDLAEWSPAASQVWTVAEDVLGADFLRVCREGPQEELSLTANTQPAVVLDSLARIAALQETHQYENPGLYSGNSLGFYTALIAAGCLSLPDGFRLVKKRGEISGAVNGSRSSMVAVVGTTEDVDAALREQFGLSLCLDNTHTQKVYGGNMENVSQAVEWTQRLNNGATAYPLDVQGAFHSPHMQQAVEPLARVLDTVNIMPPTRGVLIGICNVAPLRTPDDIRQELLDQLTTTVRWREVTHYLRMNGVEHIIEVGAAPRLTEMSKETLGGERERLTFPRVEGKGRPPTIAYLWKAQ